MQEDIYFSTTSKSVGELDFEDRGEQIRCILRQMQSSLVQ